MSCISLPGSAIWQMGPFDLDRVVVESPVISRIENATFNAIGITNHYVTM